jgi:hypothetical protein
MVVIYEGSRMLKKSSSATDRDAGERMVCLGWLVSLVFLVEPEQLEEPSKPNRSVLLIPGLARRSSLGTDGEADHYGDIRPGVENL